LIDGKKIERNQRDYSILKVFSTQDQFSRKLFMSAPEEPKGEIDRLLIAVVQGQDADMALQALHGEGVRVTRLPSVGAFLGRKNATLMVGIQASDEEMAVKILNETCRQRVDYIVVPMENAPLPMPAPTPITVGGASVFSLEVDHYEEF
jgi:uncharacterized protein YaaQ